MIKVKDGYAKLIGTTASGTANRVLLSNGSDFGLHTGRNNEANKIVCTDASGYIQAGLINTTSSDMGTTAINRIYCSNDGFIRYKTPTDFFSTLANDSNQLSITVGSQNRKLTVAYATNSDTVDGYHANELFTDLSNSGNNLSVTIGETTKKLTVNYASNASSATKLTSSAGSAILPIYFLDGKPVACSFQHYYIFNNNNIPYIKLFTLKITQAYINTPITFNIKGRSGREAFIAIKFSNGDTTDPTITYFKGWGGYSGYYTRLRICKTDTSTWEVWKMSQAEGYDLGYVWDMQIPSGITFTWNNTTSSTEPTYATYTNCTIETISANISGNATTASKLGTSTIGSEVKPIYLNEGIATASSSTVGGIAKPMYLNAGTMTELSATVGSSSLPVYLNTGTLTVCNSTLGVSITGNAATANLLKGIYTGNGGNQLPNYFGKGKVGALMMNTSINGNSEFKDFFIMDCYVGSDVGGAVAFGVNRQSLGAYIMRSTAERTSWNQSAELLGTHNYTMYTVKKDGTGASGIWNISITGNAATATKLTTSAGNAALPIYFSDGEPVACVASSVFSDLSNSGNNLSITIAGQNRTLTVNYANSAGYTKRLYANSISNLTTHPGDYSLAYSRFRAGVSNIFPTINNANGVITAHLHDGNYFAQIGLSSDGRMYYRTMMDQTLNAGVTWNKVAFTSDIPTKISQLTNDSGFITGGPYLPLTGGTLSGNLTVGQKDANRTISIAGNTSHLKMIAHTNATYIESGNKDWNGNTPLLITGYSGSKGSNLYLYFDNIYCRSSSNSYVNLDSGNWSNYITIPTLYERNLGINGTNWAFSSPYNTAIPTIYAPTSAGTSGQVLVSNGGGAPSWKPLSIKDTDISWGTTSLQGKLSIIEMAYSNVHSSNKLAFGKVKGITLEYSQNGESSWVELTGDAWDHKKLNLISGISSSVSTGNRTTDNTANDRLRITLNAVAMGIYTRPRKLLININTNVTTQPYATVKVEYSTIGNPTSYTVYGTYNISGQSGWNSIPLTSLSTFGGASNQTSNIQNIRLTFANNNANKYLNIQDIYMIGQTNWRNPSNMSKTGHLYSYNYDQDMILPSSLSLGGVDNFNKKINYLAPEGYLYIAANNINSDKTGGIVIKTTKNSVVSQVLLESNSDYGKVRITGDLCIGGRKSNTTAFISSDAVHDMYFSVQEKVLLVCNSSENSIRGGVSYADSINLGTTSYPWKAVYSKSLCLKDYGYESTIKPNSKITNNVNYTLPSVGGTLLVDTQGTLVKGWVKIDFSYDSNKSSTGYGTYSTSIEGEGSSIYNYTSGGIYYPYFSEVGILLYIPSLTNIMYWGFTSNGTVVLQANYSYGTAGNKGLRIYCKDSTGNILTSGSGTLFFIKFN